MDRANRKTSRGASRILWTGIFIALMVGAVAAWYGGVRNLFFPTNWGVVEPGEIYRSGQISRRIMRDTLTRNHIGVVVDLSREKTADAVAERNITSEMGVQRLNFPLGGNGLGKPEMYVKAITAIDQARREGKPVLVHCQAGAQRTGGVIAAYRILVEGEDPESAFKEMLRYGHDPSKNPKLIPFVRAHLVEWADQLARAGVIKSVATTAPAPATEAADAGR